MRPVSSLDAALLYAETAEMPLHTLGVIVLDAPVGFRGSPFATMEKLFRERIHQVAPFRRRLVEGPLGLGDPHWIEDPRFDLANHLLEVELPRPRGPRELAAFVGEYAGRLLDRRRPLWEMVLIPHLGSATEETRGAMAKLAADNVAAILSGAAPLTPVN